MTLARKQLISIDATPFYHIVTKCVRRAFLCGKDKYSGKSYEHRRGLIVDRVKYLASVFHIMIYVHVNAFNKLNKLEVENFHGKIVNKKSYQNS
ncbi:MAG: hypothetical protein JKX98_12650 [Alcanivoracaceae bacterium]|nr:hypothetical protein [Alcanivoracaceae bacterium]